MRTRYLLLSILLISVVGTAGVASGSDEYGAQCQEYNTVTVVGVAPTGEQIAENTTLYPGSELTVVVCGDDGTTIHRNDGEKWDIEPAKGYEITDRIENGVKIRLTTTYTGIDISQDINASYENKPQIQLQRDLLYADQNNFFNTKLTLSNPDSKQELNESVRAFQNAAVTLNNLSAGLADVSISEDSSPKAVNDYLTILQNVTNSQQKLNNETVAIRRILYEQALTQTNAENLTTAMNATNSTRAAIEINLTDTVDESLNSLEEAQSNVQSEVRRNIGFGIAGGILLGGILGTIIPWRKGKEVSDFYQVSSKNEFTADVLKFPWIVGIILLVGGVVAMFLFDITEVIV